MPFKGVVLMPANGGQTLGKPRTMTLLKPSGCITDHSHFKDCISDTRPACLMHQNGYSAGQGNDTFTVRQKTAMQHVSHIRLLRWSELSTEGLKLAPDVRRL
jgi:hypothetical protein